MNSTIGVTGAKGQPLSIDGSVGLRTSTDLCSLMLDAADISKAPALPGGGCLGIGVLDICQVRVD
jgi:hypothetical protein